MGADAGGGCNPSRADGAEPVEIHGGRGRGRRSEAWSPPRLFAKPVRLHGHETVCKEGIPKMDNSVAIAGIDVSKDKLDVHILPGNLVFTIRREKRGLASLASRLRKAGVGRVALEASGDYERMVMGGARGRGLRRPAAQSDPRASLRRGRRHPGQD